MSSIVKKTRHISPIIPDLKYCSAHGETPEEALREVLIAKVGVLAVMREEGLPIPEPRYRPIIYQMAY